ncbi:MAG: hypothetical protein VX387_03290 [Planctomycetota bacterium]|nr:hypothetical protein [Planctomycetota bacterium]
MKNIPEINHCIPNPRAYWCPFCKAHNTYDFDGESYFCNACYGAWPSIPGSSTPMIRPRQQLRLKPVLIVVTGVLFLAGVELGLGELYRTGGNWNHSKFFGIPVMLVGFGAFSGFCAWAIHYNLKQWSAWASAQRRKSPEELRQEALDHPFQPEYDNSADFTEWAEQFLTSEEVERLHEKYGESEDGEKQEARIVLRVEGESQEPPPPAPGE